jgi:hypothetical protein
MLAACSPAPVTREPSSVRALPARIPLGLRPWLHQLRGGLLRLVRQLHNYYGEVRLLAPVHHRLRLLTFPMRAVDANNCRPDARYPRFQRDPCARDVALDHGGTTMPRITALYMLRATIETVSAPASSSFRGSLLHPMHPLCTLRVRRHRRLTQHSLPDGLLGLTWAGLAPADRASFAWTRTDTFNSLDQRSEPGVGPPARHATA